MTSIPDIDARIADSQARRRTAIAGIAATWRIQAAAERDRAKYVADIVLEDEVTDGLLLIRYSAATRA